MLALALLACVPDTKPTDTGETGAPGEPTWGYSGETGPEHWGDLSEEWATCGEGTAQSPIDIVTDDVVVDGGPPPTIAWGSTALSAYNPGYYLRYEVEPGSTLTWNGHTYRLVQFHFHALSEHTVDGAHTDIEIHFVHEREDDATQLAVVGVFANADPDHGLAGIFDEGGALAFRDALALPESHEATALGGTADLGELFDPTHAESILHYTGSLTTPPCTEGVEFFLAGGLLPMLPADVEAFHALYDDNYRPVQPLNGRTVTLAARVGG